MSSLKGHEVFISQMKDQIRIFQRQNRPIMTSFLSLTEQNILKSMVPKNIQLVFDGGYDDAERKIALFIPENMDVYSDCVCLHATYNSKFKTLTHKDLLGCLMHLGIERSVLGDLVIQDEDLYIFCKHKIAPYIIDNCILIGKCSVSFPECFDSTIKQKNKEEIHVMCSSLRLDCFVAQLSHSSRGDAMKKIKAGLVKVNDVVLEENVQLCNNDFVSIRKTGRFQFKGVISKTKKGRLVLEVDKYI